MTTRLRKFLLIFSILLCLPAAPTSLPEVNPRTIEFAKGYTLLVRFVENGQTLMAVTREGELLKWNYDTGKEVFRIKLSGEISFAEIFAENILTFDEQGKLTLYDFSGKLVKASDVKYTGGHAAKINSAQIRISIGEQQPVVLNVPTLQPAEEKGACNQPVTEDTEYFSADCSWLVKVVEGERDNQRQRNQGGSITFIRLSDNKITGVVKDLQRTPWGDFIGFTQDGYFLAHVSNNLLAVYRASTGNALIYLAGSYGPVADLWHSGNGRLRIAISDSTPIASAMGGAKENTKIYLYEIDESQVTDKVFGSTAHVKSKAKLIVRDEPRHKSEIIEQLSPGTLAGYVNATGKFCDTKSEQPWVKVMLQNHLVGYVCLSGAEIKIPGMVPVPAILPEIIELRGSFVDSESQEPLAEMNMLLKIGDNIVAEFETNKKGEYKVPVFLSLLTGHQRSKLLAGSFSFTALLWGREMGTFAWESGPLTLPKAQKKNTPKSRKKKKLKKKIRK